MIRDELHATVDRIAAYEFFKASMGGREAGHAMVDLLPDSCLDTFGVIGRGGCPVGSLMITGDSAGCIFQWFAPMAPLHFAYHGHGCYLVAAQGGALDDGVDWKGMIPGILEVHDPDARPVVEAIFARFFRLAG